MIFTYNDIQITVKAVLAATCMIQSTCLNNHYLVPSKCKCVGINCIQQTSASMGKFTLFSNAFIIQFTVPHLMFVNVL